MSRSDPDVTIVPSLLDRLLDDQPAVPQESILSRSQNVRALKRSVSRDLEALLNTRREALQDLPDDFVELSRSILNYGLADFTSFNLLSQVDRARARRYLEDAITIFETRLARVNVTLEPPRHLDRALRFRVTALLRVDPAPEPVTFDAVLQLTTQEYVVQGQD
jgi:type VI secretion system protein ImpF